MIVEIYIKAKDYNIKVRVENTKSVTTAKKPLLLWVPSPRGRWQFLIHERQQEKIKTLNLWIEKEEGEEADSLLYSSGSIFFIE